MVLKLNDPAVLEYNAKYRYIELADIQDLVSLLRNSEFVLSHDLRCFVADILEGKIKKKRGVKVADWRKGTLGKYAQQTILKMEVDELTFELQLKNKAKPVYGYDARAEAMVIVAKQRNLKSAEQLDKIIYPRSNKPSKTK